MFAILLLSLALCDGFTEYQQTILRRQCIDHHAPQSSGIIDTILARDYAFTDQQKLLTHIDALKFQCCPNSFSNVLAHEINHLNGRQHNVIYTKDDPMSYAITVQQNGDIIDDGYLLPPLLMSQPWAPQILNRSSSGMRSIPVGKKYLPVTVKVYSL